MKNSTKINLVIIAFINWGISLFVNEVYNYISAVILAVSLIYLLINVKEVTGCKCESINLCKLFNSKQK